MSTPAHERPVAGGRTELEAAIDALQMPPAGLRLWLERNRAFCVRHGGRRYYAELLDLYDDCMAVLAARKD